MAELEPDAESDLWLYLLLSLTSDDLNQNDMDRLRDKQAPTGSTILYSRQYSVEG